VESAWLGAPGDRAFREAPYRAYYKTFDPLASSGLLAVQRVWKNALILLVIRGVDAGDDRS